MRLASLSLSFTLARSSLRRRADGRIYQERNWALTCPSSSSSSSSSTASKPNGLDTITVALPTLYSSFLSKRDLRGPIREYSLATPLLSTFSHWNFSIAYSPPPPPPPTSLFLSLSSSNRTRTELSLVSNISLREIQIYCSDGASIRNKCNNPIGEFKIFSSKTAIWFLRIV